MNIWDLYDNGNYVGTYKTDELTEKLGIYKDTISRYYEHGFVLNGRYTFEKVNKDDHLFEEWNKYRMMIRNAKPKMVKTVMKKGYDIKNINIWKDNKTKQNKKVKKVLEK